MNTSTAADSHVQSIVRQALIEYAESVNERRHTYQGILDDLAKEPEEYQTEAKYAAERVEYFRDRYEILFGLISAVDFGNVTFFYDDRKEPF
jgi:hypothetical protein